MARCTPPLLLILASLTASAAEPVAKPDTSLGDRLAAEYLRVETQKVTDNCLAEIKTLDDWNARREEYRRQLREMLGLDPWPERTPLEPVVTGKIDHEDFAVEKLHFQSSPGLYVTANLHLPKNAAVPAPTILYVCGHSRQVQGKTSFGNKTGYQHHGEWYARNGYVCLTIDTIELGEIQGNHHGTHRDGMWWWNSRGYTPAGVEAWNGIRALDYLETRPEVDKTRFGVTGRSGGGAYSWWIAALDERIKAAVPVAGITSMKNHIVDDCIEGHCDCMFMVNTWQWDFPQVAALVAPRPLLISNSDKDRIFPLDGVYDVYVRTRRIYDLCKAGDQIGLHITEGPHSDTQQLRVHEFVWFEEHLKRKEERSSGDLDTRAPKLFKPAELTVFDELPRDERVTTAHEWFVPQASEPRAPKSAEEWEQMREGWMTTLHEKVFRGLREPVGARPIHYVSPSDNDSRGNHEGVWIQELEGRPNNRRPYELLLLDPGARTIPDKPTERCIVQVVDQSGWETFCGKLAAVLPNSDLARGQQADPEGWGSLRKRLIDESSSLLVVAPRGIGRAEWTRDPKERTHLLRRFALLGQSVDTVRVRDVREALMAANSASTNLEAEGDAAVWALYAALLGPTPSRVHLTGLPTSHMTGPSFLNVLKSLDIPVAVAMLAEKTEVQLDGPDAEQVGRYARECAAALGWKHPVVVSRN